MAKTLLGVGHRHSVTANMFILPLRPFIFVVFYSNTHCKWSIIKGVPMFIKSI